MTATERESGVNELIELDHDKDLVARMKAEILATTPEIVEDIPAERFDKIISDYAADMGQRIVTVSKASYGRLSDEQLEALLAFRRANPWYGPYLKQHSADFSPHLAKAMETAFKALVDAAEEAIQAKEIEQEEEAVVVPPSERPLT